MQQTHKLTLRLYHQQLYTVCFVQNFGAAHFQDAAIKKKHETNLRLQIRIYKSAVQQEASKYH